MTMNGVTNVNGGTAVSRWKCDTCLITNAESDYQCKACETYRPNYKPPAVSEKDRLAGMFRTSSAPPNSSPPSLDAAPLTSAFTFGVSSAVSSVPVASTQSTFSFAAATTPSTAFSFGTTQSSTVTPAPIPAQPTSATNAPTTFSFGFAPVPLPTEKSHAASIPGATKETRLGTHRPQPELNGSEVPIGDVFVHGSGECEQLGLGDGVTERRKPTLVKSLLGKKIYQICVSSLHCLAVSTDGVVYSWGCNDDGALGRAGQENTPLPITDGPMGSVAIRSVHAGDNHSAFLDWNGRAFLCGSYKDSGGYLGFPNFAGKDAGAVVAGKDLTLRKAIEPVLVEGLPPRSRVEQLSCGSNHTVAVISSTDRRRTSVAKPAMGLRIVAWGNDEFGQLGIDTRGDPTGLTELDSVMLKHTRRGKRQQLTKLFPRDVQWNHRTGNGVRKICATAQGTFVITMDGTVFGCGLNNFGQLGLPETSATPQRILCEIPALSNKSVEHISGGSLHAAARCADGEVYAWGRQDYCGVGKSNADEVCVPTRVSGLSDVRYIACGGSHTMVCTKFGDAYSWGFGGTNQLGNCPRDISGGVATADAEPVDEMSPYKIQSKQLQDKFVLQVGCGAQHSAELGWNGEYSEIHVPVMEPKTPSRKKSVVGGEVATATKRTRTTTDATSPPATARKKVRV